MKNDIPYEEPIEEEMDDDCVAKCRPGEHKCEKKKVVLIKLVQVGREKVNDQFTIPRKGRSEQELAEVALKRCKQYLMSNDVELYPDEQKGDGFWKLRVGMGYHVGDVEIIL